MPDTGLISLLLLGLVLGLQHGVDWDHIAAITDITASATDPPVARERRGGQLSAGGPAAAVIAPEVHAARPRLALRGFLLASVYALGHASVVTALGLLALWTGAILPSWLDPIMEKVVGATLLLLGAWIFYSLVRHGRSFRLMSRWMLVFALVRRATVALSRSLRGRPHAHVQDSLREAQYGGRTAFGIGMIHGVGAQTGTQALLLASAAGATSGFTGSMLLLSFVVGLVISNSLIGAFSVLGFISSSTKRTVYVVVGIAAASFSVVLGVMFLTGQGTLLPDLQRLMERLFS